jgi:hypothetical protein
MSEPNSLFARIHLSKERFETFLAAPPKPPVLDANWTNWWNTRKMYSPHPLSENDLYAYNAASNKAILDGWMENKNTGTFYDYDETGQTLNLGLIFFSENYGEMIPMLSFILSLAEYKENNPDDFCIVFPFFWGDEDLSVYITFEGNTARLDAELESVAQLDPAKLKYAEDYLQRKAAEIFPQD